MREEAAQLQEEWSFDAYFSQGLFALTAVSRVKPPVIHPVVDHLDRLIVRLGEVVQEPSAAVLRDAQDAIGGAYGPPLTGRSLLR